MEDFIKTNLSIITVYRLENNQGLDHLKTIIKKILFTY